MNHELTRTQRRPISKKFFNNHRVHGVSRRKFDDFCTKTPCFSAASVVSYPNWTTPSRINKYCFLILTIFFFFSLFAFTSCIKSVTEPVIEFQVKPIQRYNLTLLAAGDNLFHMPIVNTHRQRDGSFNFDPIYAPVKELIQNADLAFINQETVMAGAGFEYSGFPGFNTPQALAQTLKNTGFDIINLANNHAMDMGRTGLYNTLDLLNEIEQFTVIGARKFGVNYRLIRKNNITLGFLAYTFSLNGIPLPRGEPNLVSLTNRSKMAEELKVLRALCDFLVVSIHWGEEYRLIEPDSFQKDTALFLANSNADLIIGHHPHVLQRVELLPRPDGGQTLCFYSLGNFVSNQTAKDRVLGGMIAVTFSKEYKNGEEDLSISYYGLIPVVTHFEAGFTNTKVYPYYEYTEDLLKKHLLHIRDGSMTFDYFKNVLNRLDTKIIMHNPF